MISDLFRGRAEEHLVQNITHVLRDSSFNSMTTRELVVMKLGRSESSMMISRLGEYTVDLSSVSVAIDLPDLGITLPQIYWNGSGR